ncbi:MAG: hemolysin family protein [Kiritimatiellia bacterium]
MTLLLLSSVLLLLLLFSAFFSSAETVFFSLSPITIHRIRRKRPRAAREIETLLATPTQLLSTILIGNTLSNIIAATIGYLLAETFFPGRGTLIAIVGMTVLLIIFCELAPKRLAMQRTERMAVIYHRPLRVMVMLLTPARLLLEAVTRHLEKYFRPHRPALTGDELLTAVDVVHEAGAINYEERLMVDGIIRLEEIQAKDVMTPRVDLVGIDLEDSPTVWEQTARRAHFRFLPVYRDSLDEIEGFLDVPRFLLDPDLNLRNAIFPPFFVPDTAPLDTLLTSFQQQNRRIAIVIDEFGGTAGMITRGDILDEIVESVDNEFDDHEMEIQALGPNHWLINGNVSLEDVNYELDLDLEADGADRMAGWFTAWAEHVPRLGETIEAQGCRVTVRQMKKHRITMLQLEKTPTAEPDNGNDIY